MIAVFVASALWASPCYSDESQSAAPSSGNTALILAVSVEERDPFEIPTDFDNDSPFFDRLNPPDPATQRRADTFVLIKFAADNYRFLRWFGAAIRNSESVMDDYARRYRLKGNLVIADSRDNGVSTRKEIHLGGDIPTVSVRPHRSRADRSPWIPSTVSWNLGMDVVSSRISGRLDVGQFLDIEASVGSDTRIAAKIVLPF